MKKYQINVNNQIEIVDVNGSIHHFMDQYIVKMVGSNKKIKYSWKKGQVFTNIVCECDGLIFKVDLI